MRFFKVNIMPMDTAFAFTKERPSGFKESSYKLSDGERVVDADGYPPDARVHMAEGFGRDLGGIVGNTYSLLIVSRPMKEAIGRLHTEDVQCLPLAIYNHKRRLASAGYFILNPVGFLDCLDLEASEIEYEDGDVVEVEKMVLSEDKLVGAPDLFRVREDPATYVVSLALLRAWIGLQPRPKNVYVDELPVTPAETSRTPSKA